MDTVAVICAKCDTLEQWYYMIDGERVCWSCFQKEFKKMFEDEGEDFIETIEMSSSQDHHRKSCSERATKTEELIRKLLMELEQIQEFLEDEYGDKVYWLLNDIEDALVSAREVLGDDN